MPKTETPELHPDLGTISFLLGKWAGEGRGEYPTTETFEYGEEATYSHMGKPFVAYTQRSWDLDEGRPLHTEMGYLRCPAQGRIEIVVAHPSGHAELSEGIVTATSIHTSSAAVVGAGSSKEVRELRRRIEVNGDELRYELDMAAVGQPMVTHLKAVLRRVSGH